MSLFRLLNESSFSNILLALKNSIGVGATRPYIAGKRVSAALNFGNTNAQTSADLTIPCTGAKVGDQVIVGVPAPTAGSCYTGHVATVDIVTIRFNNYSTGAINPASATFTATVIPSS